MKMAHLRKTINKAFQNKPGKLNDGLVRMMVLRLYAKFSVDDPVLVFNVDHDLAKLIHPLAIGLLDRDKIQSRYASLGYQSVLVNNPGTNTAKRYHANTPILHWPDPNFFNAPAAAGSIISEAQALEMMYNSKMAIATDETNRQSDLDTSIFKAIGTTQHSTTTQNEYGEAHIQDLGRDMVFVGGDSTEIRIPLRHGDFAPCVGPADGSRENYAVLQFYGAVTKNAAKKRVG